MSAEDDALAELVAACRGLLDAQGTLATARERRTEALRHLQAAGVPQRQLSRVAVEHLRRVGFTGEEIGRLGLSYGNVRNK